MAWSDAARAAALEVRRAHARAKANDMGRKTAINATPLSKNVMADPKTRKWLADRLREFRAGGKQRAAAIKRGHVLDGYALGGNLINKALGSTWLRNSWKRKRR